MADERVEAPILARLRANAAAAGIALSDEELARITGGMYFRNVDAFGQLVDRLATDMLPDDLKAWGVSGEREGAVASEGGDR